MSRERERYRERERDNAPDRPVFCGNFEYDAEEREILRLFEKYGPVDKIDMKTGFAFVYMKDKRDGDDAIRKLDRMEFGYKRRPLRVEWAKQTENDRKRETKPSTTLFVVNFDQRRVTERDIERHFDKYGRLLRVEIKKNYAFVQYESQDTATRALEATNGSQLLNRQIAVEYVERDGWGRDVHSGDRPRDDDRRGGRSRSRSPYGRRASPPRRRSPSPRGRSPPRRASPRRSPPRGRSPPRRSPPRRSPSPRRGRSPVRPRSPRNDRSPSYDR